MEVYEFLLRQAELYGVRVVERSLDCSAYNMDLKRINICFIDTEIRELILAHELGHHIDFSCLSYEYIQHCNRMHNLFQLGDNTAKKNVVLRERRAWKNARTLLKLAGFTDWGKFREFRRKGIKSYEDYK